MSLLKQMHAFTLVFVAMSWLRQCICAPAVDFAGPIPASYFWLNRTNVNSKVVPEYLRVAFNSVNKQFGSALDIKVYFYNDIFQQLKSYDSELALYYSRINPALPALLSDIGRYIILYNQGGFYHDARFSLESKEALKDIVAYCNLGVDVVFHQRVLKLTQIKTANMLACKKKAVVFDSNLQQQKLKLRALFDETGPSKARTNETIINITSRTVSNVFIKQSVCGPDHRPTVCIHNNTVLLITKWKLTDHRTREFYNFNQVPWSRTTTVPLFVDSMKVH